MQLRVLLKCARRFAYERERFLLDIFRELFLGLHRPLKIGRSESNSANSLDARHERDETRRVLRLEHFIFEESLKSTGRRDLEGWLRHMHACALASYSLVVWGPCINPSLYLLEFAVLIHAPNRRHDVGGHRIHSRP